MFIKNCFVLLLFLTIALFVASISTSAQDVNSESSGQPWQLSVRFKTSDVLPESVQFAIFDKDPVPGFMDRLSDNLTGSKEKRITKYGLWYRSKVLGDLWDSGFQEITGDKVYLIDVNSMWGTSDKTSDIQIIKKWIVTKNRQIDGEAFYWSVPVELMAGKSIEVILSDENRFDIDAAYNDAVVHAAYAMQ